jgi:hypothetical protein
LNKIDIDQDLFEKNKFKLFWKYWEVKAPGIVTSKYSQPRSRAGCISISIGLTSPGCAITQAYYV